eukprot:8033124-Alexandrium_andersonii.AAC.1
MCARWCRWRTFLGQRQRPKDASVGCWRAVSEAATAARTAPSQSTSTTTGQRPTAGRAGGRD